MDYVFITDASCDLNEKQVSEIGVQVIPMEFQMEGKSFLHYPDRHMMSLEEFYSKLKNGADVKTTQINYNTFYNYFEDYLKAGKDILYTGISTGLSGTYNTCLIAVNELREKYPDRKIVIIDSFCDSAGLGFLVYLAGQKYMSGASIEELSTFIEVFLRLSRARFLLPRVISLVLLILTGVIWQISANRILSVLFYPKVVNMLAESRFQNARILRVLTLAVQSMSEIPHLTTPLVKLLLCQVQCAI